MNGSRWRGPRAIRRVRTSADSQNHTLSQGCSWNESLSIWFWYELGRKGPDEPNHISEGRRIAEICNKVEVYWTPVRQVYSLLVSKSEPVWQIRHWWIVSKTQTSPTFRPLGQLFSRPTKWTLTRDLMYQTSWDRHLSLAHRWNIDGPLTLGYRVK